MNVLLTGGMEYIGSYVAADRVVLYDNLCDSDARVLARIEQITGKTPFENGCEYLEVPKSHRPLRKL